MFDNKSILITGRTGSFGKQWTKTILENDKLKKLIIYLRDELKQFGMSQKVQVSCMPYSIDDVRDQDILRRILANVDIAAQAQLSQTSSL
ncbi:MAG: polysaccharide biosynthesis protein [Methylobacter sp.]|jgi:UDP-N-acetylglucosamine 4,6-dehydratase|uniref:polysaccharide biosynthesis protein n=1 Tax=Methylobacter sp. TaxID=2051955 RepID=UPI0025FDF271|nr:polysaccharide biosynthesis protein [Methylobacter sp.]MCK9621178.1 polysaccharide biosynthesis protein [Methylobacter sp.]